MTDATQLHIVSVMTRTEGILDLLRERGHRQTPARIALIEAFSQEEKPLSAPELLACLVQRGVFVNKTTLYRELSFLQAQGIVTDVRFDERLARYELADAHGEGHHHHVVCTTCDRVEDVHLPGDLRMEERALEQQTRFVIDRHVLEFFGTCVDCRPVC